MDSWLKSVLENVPHGEEGHLQLDAENALFVQKLLVDRGYAVLMTSGEQKDDYRISWIYAGSTDNLKYADINNVCFTSMDYLWDYPDAVMKSLEEENE